MRKAVWVAAIAAVIGTPALAADMALKAPPPLPAWSWTGFYVGANVGYSWGRDTTDFFNTTTVTGGGGGTIITGAGGSAAGNMDGWLGGFQAGYNYQSGYWVVGLETDFQWTGQDDDPTFCAIPGCPVGSAFGTNTTKLPWFGTFRGRVGVTTAPSSTWRPVLLYVTGGLAYGRIDETYTEGLVGGPTGTVTADTTRAGWTVGGGGEARLGQSNWSLKLEYLFMDFGHVSGGVSATGAPVFTPVPCPPNPNPNLFGACGVTTITSIAGSASTHVTDNILRVGLNYKFGP